mmetsp:Transcript_37790/g.107957  ORF Transcript_37790/g.107957 Transcript_37790/m.107957 type:complete len:411 (-) Transcript_37790:100-1332(-)
MKLVSAVPQGRESLLADIGGARQRCWRRGRRGLRQLHAVKRLACSCSREPRHLVAEPLKLCGKRPDLAREVLDLAADLPQCFPRRTLLLDQLGPGPLVLLAFGLDPPHLHRLPFELFALLARGVALLSAELGQLFAHLTLLALHLRAEACTLVVRVLQALNLRGVHLKLAPVEARLRLQLLDRLLESGEVPGEALRALSMRRALALRRAELVQRAAEFLCLAGPGRLELSLHGLVRGLRGRARLLLEHGLDSLPLALLLLLEVIDALPHHVLHLCNFVSSAPVGIATAGHRRGHLAPRGRRDLPVARGQRRTAMQGPQGVLAVAAGVEAAGAAGAARGAGTQRPRPGHPRVAGAAEAPVRAIVLRPGPAGGGVHGHLLAELLPVPLLLLDLDAAVHRVAARDVSQATAPL